MSENSLEDEQKLLELQKQAQDQDHKHVCEVIDDNITHVERGLDVLQISSMANRMLSGAERFMEHAMSKNWSVGHHAEREPDPKPEEPQAQDAATEGKPSPRGQPSVAKKVLGPLAAAAAGGAIVAGANYLMTEPAEPSPSSDYQFLEDGGFHIPPPASERPDG